MWELDSRETLTEEEKSEYNQNLELIQDYYYVNSRYWYRKTPYPQ